MSTPINEWLQALIESAHELATTTLGFTKDEVVVKDHGSPLTSAGSYVALIGDDTSIQIGIASTVDACDKLARALLMMPPEDELSTSDLADALGEIANVLAGGVKRRMVHRDTSLKLGLPVVVNGRLATPERMEIAAAEILFGGIDTMLLVFREGSNPKKVHRSA